MKKMLAVLMINVLEVFVKFTTETVLYQKIVIFSMNSWRLSELPLTGWSGVGLDS